MKTLKMVFLMVILSLFVNGVVFAMVNVKGSWEGEIRIPPADYATDITVKITTQNCDMFRGTVRSDSLGISGKISGKIFSIMNQQSIIDFRITITSPCSGAFTGKAILNQTGTRIGFLLNNGTGCMAGNNNGRGYLQK